MPYLEIIILMQHFGEGEAALELRQEHISFVGKKDVAQIKLGAFRQPGLKQLRSPDHEYDRLIRADIP